MIRRLLVLATLIVALFAAPGVASAGCNTYIDTGGAAPVVEFSDNGTPANHADDFMDVAGVGAYCPSVNTNLYHSDLYMQELIGTTWGEPTALASNWALSATWRNVTTAPGWPYFVDNFGSPNAWQCDDFTQAATQARVRLKVVNETTGSVTPMAYSPATVLPSTCY